jgi:hypothetical protein
VDEKRRIREAAAWIELPAKPPGARTPIVDGKKMGVPETLPFLKMPRAGHRYAYWPALVQASRPDDGCCAAALRIN